MVEKVASWAVYGGVGRVDGSEVGVGGGVGGLWIGEGQKEKVVGRTRKVAKMPSVQCDANWAAS